MCACGFSLRGGESVDAARDSSSVSLLLREVQQGRESAREQLFGRLFAELRGAAARLMRNERPGHTLGASALLNEAILRLLADEVVEQAADRRFLFTAAIRAMKQVLVDHARRRNSHRRGGDRRQQPLDEMLVSFEEQHGFDLEALDDALARLSQRSPRQRDVIESRFFGDLSVQETAELLDVSIGTVERDWRLARAWLYRELRGHA